MRIRPRFSLRILLSFVTVVAILLGWKTNREHEREQAIAALSRAGATVMVEDSVPAWVKKVLGERTGEYVLAVVAGGPDELSGPAPTGSVKRGEFGHVPHEPLADGETLVCRVLRYRSLAKLTDADVARIGRFDKCQLVDLSHTALRDASLPHLGVLHRLEYLYLSDTAITDAGLAHLHDLKSLRRVDLRGTRVTPAGIDALLDAIPGVRVSQWPEREWPNR